MPRFFLHMHNSTGLIEDEEGHELPDLASARAKAIEGIRSILAEEVLRGSLNLHGRIEIAGEAGDVLAVLPFRDAIELHLDEEAA